MAILEPMDDESLESSLTRIGPQLKAARERRGVTLTDLSATTGISVSTLSRLENGRRRPNLELLLPVAQALRTSLDDIVGIPLGDPRVPSVARRQGPLTVVPLSREPGNRQTYKLIIPASLTEPEPRTHEGYEWLYVLSGRLRLVLGEHDVVMTAGEAAEFDTRVPHWMGSTGDGPVELLSIFGRQGVRIHLRTGRRYDS
jgi:transcriptional regulator with XRE-family HTH domain